MAVSPTGLRAPNLAFCYQEIFTICARLRARKAAVADATAFRVQLRKSLQLAESAANNLGYPEADVRLGSYAVIALLDETILNSSNPAFRDYARKPLMLDLYNTLTAGDGFFENLGGILARRESGSTVDLLEVYGLALLLGFRGRYGAAAEEQIASLREPIFVKINRHRYATGTVELSRSWRPEAVIDMPASPNRLTSIMTSVLLAAVAAAGLLFAMYSWLLIRGVAELAAVAAGEVAH